MNYQQNRKYFKQSGSPLLPIGLIAVGLLALTNTECLGIGLVLAIVGGAILYMQRGGRPTDQDVDAQVNAALKNMIPKGLAKLGLDGDEVRVLPPIPFSGPYDHAEYTKLGKDGRPRASTHQAVVLFFSENQVYVYTNRFSLIEQESRESTEEYFYRDITGVSTSQGDFPVTTGTGTTKQVQVDTFRLNIPGADPVMVFLTGHDQVGQSIQGMKQLIREKKNV